MSENIVTPFLFEGEGLVRVMVRGGEPWFVGIDVAAVLGYAKPDNAVSRHCRKPETCPLETGGQVRHVNLIAEPDVWRLIIKSNLPDAQRIEAWLFEEVLPSIRRTGSYGKAKPEPEVIQPDRRPFPDWPMEELRTKQATVHMYRQTYGVLSAQWVAPQVGFPIPPRHLIEIGKQLDMFQPRDGGDSNVFQFPGAE